MATTSDRRKRVRPMSIRAFREKLLDHYKTTPTRKNYSTNWYVRVVSDFLDAHPSAKATSHLTRPIVEEFAASLARYKESTQFEALRHFRAFCGHAIDWGCLRSNPFDGYPLPGRRERSPSGATRRGRKLDRDQARDILEHLRGKADSWAGNRIYVFAFLISHTGMTSRQARQLKVADCDFDSGVILLRRRTTPPRAIRPPRDLMETLAAWIPLRSQGKPDRAPQARYGTRLAEDGRTLVDDAKEQTALADMRRWRGEGWSLDRIARELDRLGVPTKAGAKKWPQTTVGKILGRGGQPDAESTAVTGDRERSGPKPDLGYVFTTVSRPGYWADVSGEVRHQIREAGEALGIEGLTVDSLRRFYLENARASVDLGMPSVPAEVQPEAAPGGPWPPGGCPLSFGEAGSPVVNGATKKITKSQSRVIMALYQAGPGGVPGAELEVRSGRGGYRNILATLARDEDWASIIRTAKGPRGRYRLAMPGR